MVWLRSCRRLILDETLVIYAPGAAHSVAFTLLIMLWLTILYWALLGYYR